MVFAALRDKETNLVMRKMSAMKSSLVGRKTKSGGCGDGRGGRRTDGVLAEHMRRTAV